MSMGRDADLSTAKFRWWGFARSMIRDYPSLKAQLRDLHEHSITAGDSGTGGGGGVSRKTEQIALRTLPADDQKVFDAVNRAIELTTLQTEGEQRMKLIALMYWVSSPMSLAAAAYRIHISEPTAKRWHGAFVRLVGKCFGFEVDTSEPK